jgi:hypothetical protein
MNIRLFFTLSFFLIVSLAIASKIEGTNKEYAGRKLQFFRYSDPISQEKVHVFTLEINNKGEFATEVKTDATIFVFCDFDIYRGMLFVEPGTNVNLLLPPLRKKSFAEEKNPYFAPVEFWFSTGEKNHLNDHISRFDARLNQLTDKYFNQLYFSQSRAIFDSIQATLNQEFGSVDPGVFQQHKKLKIKAVEADAFRLSPENISPAISETGQPYLNHPAFIQLLEKAYANKLSFEAKSMQGNQVRQAVAKGDISFFMNLLKEKYAVTGTTANLAFLKMLHDAFYTGDFSQNNILKILTAGHFSSNQNQLIRETAENVLIKLQHLREGTAAPVICLENTDGHRRCTIENNGKFKYVLFADTEMIVVKEHLKYLTRIEEMFKEHLEIYVILRKTDLIEMKIFLEKENIPGIHLIDTNGEFIEKYRVKSFPDSFLLNNKHEVVFKEAKAPLDGFEHQFGTFLRKELFMRQRDQAR